MTVKFVSYNNLVGFVTEDIRRFEDIDIVEVHFKPNLWHAINKIPWAFNRQGLQQKILWNQLKSAKYDPDAIELDLITKNFMRKDLKILTTVNL